VGSLAFKKNWIELSVNLDIIGSLDNIGRFVGGNQSPWRKPTLSERVPLYHMRNGSDQELNPRPQRWQVLILISNIDLTTSPLWHPRSFACPGKDTQIQGILVLRFYLTKVTTEVVRDGYWTHDVQIMSQTASLDHATSHRQ
jgi:hypothetical protein